MPFLNKKGNRVGKGAIEFDGEFDAVTNCLAGHDMMGFTICEDKEHKLFVLFPSSIVKRDNESAKPYYFLRPRADGNLDRLQDAILDVYESMTGAFNRPRSESKAEVEPTKV